MPRTSTTQLLCFRRPKTLACSILAALGLEHCVPTNMQLVLAARFDGAIKHLSVLHTNVLMAQHKPCKLDEACDRHAETCNSLDGCDLKVYCECALSELEHQLVRKHLDSQSKGVACANLFPTYRALPTSLTTVAANGAGGTKLRCFSSVCAEPLEEGMCASDRVRLAAQQIWSKSMHALKSPCRARMVFETVTSADLRDWQLFVAPEHIQKENGTTYIPLTAAPPGIAKSGHAHVDAVPLVIEVFQCWRTGTFAAMEHESTFGAAPHKIFGVRVSAIPERGVFKTGVDIRRLATRIAQFVDILVYG